MLCATDEMMSANEINMNLAAITPAVLLIYCTGKVFRFLFYSMLKLRKNREETYASFRHLLTDIERLLVMRDNPPVLAKSPLEDVDTVVEQNSVLGVEDTGMLMLHLHECRSILWKDRHRFTPHTIHSVSEDLAELAGERGKECRLMIAFKDVLAPF